MATENPLPIKERPLNEALGNKADGIFVADAMAVYYTLIEKPIPQEVQESILDRNSVNRSSLVQLFEVWQKAIDHNRTGMFSKLVLPQMAKCLALSNGYGPEEVLALRATRMISASAEMVLEN